MMEVDGASQLAVTGRGPLDLRQRLNALGASFTQSRGGRFARRLNLEEDAPLLPTLADIVNLPDWVLCDFDLVDRIAAVTALLHFRYAIDHELSGIKLRAICDTVGEVQYDLACEAPLPPQELLSDPEERLPSPDKLILIGREMLDSALPIAMASSVSGACNDIKMRQLSNIATAIVVDQYANSAGASA
jgi:hypothetical protein